MSAYYIKARRWIIAILFVLSWVVSAQLEIFQASLHEQGKWPPSPEINLILMLLFAILSMFGFWITMKNQNLANKKQLFLFSCAVTLFFISFNEGVRLLLQIVRGM